MNTFPYIPVLLDLVGVEAVAVAVSAYSELEGSGKFQWPVLWVGFCLFSQS